MVASPCGCGKGHFPGIGSAELGVFDSLVVPGPGQFAVDRRGSNDPGAQPLGLLRPTGSQGSFPSGSGEGGDAAR